MDVNAYAWKTDGRDAEHSIDHHGFELGDPFPAVARHPLADEITSVARPNIRARLSCRRSQRLFPEFLGCVDGMGELWKRALFHGRRRDHLDRHQSKDRAEHRNTHKRACHSAASLSPSSSASYHATFPGGATAAVSHCVGRSALWAAVGGTPFAEARQKIGGSAKLSAGTAGCPAVPTRFS